MASVGQPIPSPFTNERQQFTDLLISIKNKSKGIEENLEINNFKHVIIDTNYHFCNLFPQQDQHYNKLVDNGITKDTIHIWFLWVYRQLFKLLWQGNDVEREIMKRTASAIERVFEQKEIGSIIHTYTPVGLLSVPSHQGNFLTKFFAAENAARRDQDYAIKKLLELEQFKVGSYVEFRKWMQLFLQARAEVKTKNKNESQDAHLLFANVLDKATRQIVNDDNEALLPINIFPLSIYQSALAGYTKEREDAVAALRNMMESFSVFKNQ